MPIRIDLLSEHYDLEELKRRDPVKRAITYAGMAVGAVALFCLFLQVSIFIKSRQVTKNKSDFKAIQTTYDQVLVQEGKLNAIKDKLNALDEFSTNRFLWATVLNAMQQTTNRAIQVVGIESSQSFEYVPLKPGDPEAPFDWLKKDTPPSMIERTRFTIKAEDHSPQEASQFNNYVAELRTIEFFLKNLKPEDGVRLENFAPQNSVFGEGAYYTYFQVICEFPDVERKAKAEATEEE